MLQVIMQMRLECIARVAALAEKLAPLDLLASIYKDAAALKMREDGNFIRAMLNYDTIATRQYGFIAPGTLSRTPSIAPTTTPYRGRKNFATKLSVRTV